MGLLLFFLVGGVILVSITGLKRIAKRCARKNTIFKQNWVNATNARIDRQIVAEMQFNLWWQNEGHSIVDNHIVNNGIASLKAETLRDVAEVRAAHYAINQLSIAATEAQFMLVRKRMVSKQRKRWLDAKIIEYHQSLIDDETILAGLGYDPHKLRVTFLQ